MVIAKPQHTADILRKHAAKVSLRDNNFQRIQDARVAKEAVLITVVQTNTDLTIPLAALQNGIEYAAAKHSEPLDIILHGDEKVEHEGNWRTYRDRQSRLDKQRLVPAQDVHFFYTRSHLSAFQNCALPLSTNAQFIFIFK